MSGKEVIEVAEQVEERPFGVTAIAFLQVAISIAALYGWWDSEPWNVGVTDPTVYVNTASMGVALLGLVVAVGLLLMVRWAWPMALFDLSVQLGVGLWAYVHQHAVYETMFLSAVSIFYLNWRDVRNAFGFVRASESLPVE